MGTCTLEGSGHEPCPLGSFPIEKWEGKFTWQLLFKLTPGMTSLLSSYFLEAGAESPKLPCDLVNGSYRGMSLQETEGEVTQIWCRGQVFQEAGKPLPPPRPPVFPQETLSQAKLTWESKPSEASCKHRSGAGNPLRCHFLLTERPWGPCAGISTAAMGEHKDSG